ncbi:hypothetical protein MCOR27_001079 [Pyricularia oryzae]|nr:hypothetical protein MCOR27_001079 [Pyricularia oryzae]KAI6560169.1 hypothetical protein MCOR03_004460 [Pyricularia oryzae]KAI6602397.1 hypothetical protein MCOR12_003804 [Pyricularia oryzae]
MIYPLALIVPSLFLSLVGTALGAAPPKIVYRGDMRDPKTLQDCGGFVCPGDRTGTLDLDMTFHQHVMINHNENERYDQSPFISTSADKAFSAEHVQDRNRGKVVYVYYIDTSAIAHNFIDIAQSYKDIGGTYRWPWEKEFAAKRKIPWTSVVGYDTLGPGLFPRHTKVTHGGACKRGLTISGGACLLGAGGRKTTAKTAKTTKATQTKKTKTKPAAKGTVPARGATAAGAAPAAKTRIKAGRVDKAARRAAIGRAAEGR